MKAAAAAAILCLAVFRVPGAAQTEADEGLAFPSAAAPAHAPAGRGALRRFGSDLGEDFHQLYRGRPMGALWVGMAVAGVMAHTPADEAIRASYSARVWSPGTDRAAAIVKPLGNPFYTLPLYAGASLLEACAADRAWCGALGEWGQRSTRTMLVGAPLVGLLQYAVGGSMPGEGHGPEWRPFKDSHGVSGHAYAGAVPFLAAAGMVRNRPARLALILGSMACGVSRVNDDGHYASQVALGWWTAYLAARAVDATAGERSAAELVPAAGPGFAGAAVALGF